MIRRHIVSPEQRSAGARQDAAAQGQKDRLRAEIRKHASYVAPDGDADITEPEIQAGRPLHRSEVMRRLRRLNPDLRYEQALADPAKGGIYVVENRIDPLTGKSPWKRFICGIPHEQVTEFHIPCTIEARIPDPDFPAQQIIVQKLTGAIPGWRAVLLKLLKEGLVSPAGIDREFHITQGRSSRRWKEAVS
jgi:hypothetical protein